MSEFDALVALEARVEQLERRSITADGVHLALQNSDMTTATAIRELTHTLNDPKTGLIVELDKFRAEVVADRQAFRAWVRGATFVVSVVFAIFTIAAPWIRVVVESALHISSTP